MTSDNLKSKIQSDMKEAMRSKDTLRLTTIRMLMAAIKQREIDEQKTLQDNDVISIINKLIKQRRDAAQQYQEADRQELADKERLEISVLETYLPTQMSEEEIQSAIEEAFADVNPSGMQDMGKIMGVLKGKLAGRADMSKVSSLVKERLS